MIPGMILLALVLALMGCASPLAQDGVSAAPDSARQPTTLVMVVNTEVSNLSQKAIGQVNPSRTTRIFNAGLSLSDAQDTVRPYLAESLPQLNTDSWQVFPDGRMETTWKLRPGPTWQDGQPLTAEDFVFALQVYKTPGLAGIFEPKPQDRIERLVAVGPQTIRIEWRSPFLDTGAGLDPLPRARLAEPFAAFEQDPGGQRDAFMSLRYWTTEYVGAGPYRLTNWEPGSQLEGAAFDGHALGRPRIDRVIIRLINNEDTALAAILAGQVHLVMAQAMRFEQSEILRLRGGFNDAEGKGRLLFRATSGNAAVPQHRPEYQQSPGLLDVRVRKALAYAIDKDAINEALYDGQAPIPYTLVLPDAAYYPEIERAITKYLYDPRRTEQLMSEAGFPRGRDGLFLDSAGQRFQPSLWNSASAQEQRRATILANTWQRAGIGVQPFVMPNALELDQQARATFPGMLIHGGIAPQSLTSEAIGTPENRWSGGNRGGWSNPDYDLLWERYNRTLDRGEQIQALVEMMRLHSEQVPNFPLNYSLNVVAHVAALKGPEGDFSHWNLHEWALTP